jgi:hypothetical protein
MMPPGCGSTPFSVSREKLPLELRNIDISAYTVTMAYDVGKRGIHIFVAKNTAAAQTHWFVDTKTQAGSDRSSPNGVAFWPITIDSDFEPFSILERRNNTAATIDQSPVLLGGRDGYVRRFDDSLFEDDSQPFVSYIDYGPIPLAARGQEGILAEMSVVPAAGSGPIECEIRVADTAEELLLADPEVYTFDLDGLNLTVHPRVRGATCSIRFKSAHNTGAWALEEVLLGVDPGGRRLPK